MTDLHLHSNNSDGKLSVGQLVDLLFKNKIKYAALTDHDTVTGSAEFAKLAQAKDIKTIHGVEISSSEKGIGIHILGYNININDVNIRKIFDWQSRERREIFKKHIELFEKVGFKIDQKIYNQFKKLESPTKTHVFELIWASPYNQKLCFEKYGLKENTAEKQFKIQSPFIELFMEKPGQISYAQKKNTPAKDAITAIHKAGGVAVWAHPGLGIKFAKKGMFEKVFENLLGYDIDGLEAFSTASSHTKEWSAHLVTLAKKHNLIATMGSDDHNGKMIDKIKVDSKYQKEAVKKLIK